MNLFSTFVKFKWSTAVLSADEFIGFMKIGWTTNLILFFHHVSKNRIEMTIKANTVKQQYADFEYVIVP